MNQRILHLSGKESLEEYIEYITDQSADNVIFVFARKKNWIFSQTTDLIQLRTKAEEKNKILTIVTTNATERKTLQSVGIPSFGTLEDMEITPFAKQKAKKKAKGRKRKKVKNITVDPLMYIKQGKKQDNTTPIDANTTISRPALHALILLGTLALVLFIFILQIAIPEATISISPSKKEEEMHINIHALSQLHFTESDLWRENNGIFSIPFEKVFTLEHTFTHVSKEFLGENSTGKVTIDNPFSQKFTLQKGTRFVTKDGIIFITPKWLTLPANKEITVQLQARETDQYGKFQGENANIPSGQPLTIPGLAENIRSQITVTTQTAMTGGKTEWIQKITAEDIKNAKQELTRLAQKQAPQELSYLLQKYNKQKKFDLNFFPFYSSHTVFSPQVKFSVTQIIFNADEEDLIGKQTNTFTGKITVSTKNYSYSTNSLLALIESKFKKIAPEGMILSSIDKNVLVPEIISVREEGKRIKSSFSTRGVYRHIIEPKSKAGFDFVTKATQEISGMKKEQAITHLLNNFDEVSDASISLWPAWLRRLPTLPENIKFTVEAEE